MIGAGIAEFKALTEQLKKQRYLLQRCSSTLDEAGHIAYSALWQRHGSEASCSHRSRYASAFGELYPGSTLADVRLHPLNPAQRDPYSATTWFEECQQQAESALTDDQRQKAQANMVRYALAKGAPAAALESSGHLKSPQPVDLVRRYRCRASGQ